MEKILTVSVAAYNAEKCIAHCLDSMVNLNVLKQLDIIVVNDGSDDTTEAIVQSYVDRYPTSVRLINKENGGHGSTINTSIKLATGKYYKIVDSDDWVDSTNLERLVKYLACNDIDMVLNPYNEVSYSDHNRLTFFNPNGGNLLYDTKYEVGDMSNDIVLYMHSLTFKTQIIKQMGPIIDENCFYVDMEYCIFPMLYVKTFSCLQYPIYQYLLGSLTQSMNMENLVKRRDQHLRVIKRLITYFNVNANKLCPSMYEVIALRIKYAIYQQYKIYLNLSPAQACSEIKTFDIWLKQQNRVLYIGPKGKIMKFIRINRKTNYKYLELFLKIARRLKK